jgi:AcrR family transcriptional regulator
MGQRRRGRQAERPLRVDRWVRRAIGAAPRPARSGVRAIVHAMSATRKAARRRKPIAPRRVPRQARSRARVERILAVTATLVDRLGPETVTTDLIAARARVPVGTLYQFFPNKQAVFHAVVSRQLEELDRRFQPVFGAGNDAVPLAAMVGRTIEALVEAYLAVPGLARLVGAAASPELEQLYARNNARIAAWIGEVVRRRAKGIPRDRIGAIATMLVEASDGVIKHWLRERAAGRGGGDALLRELERMLAAYLGAVVPAE